MSSSTESSEFQFEGTHPSSLSQLKKSNQAVKGKVLRSSRSEYDYEENKLAFPDLTPPDLDFSVAKSCRGRKKKKRPKGITLSQLSTRLGATVELSAKSGVDSEDRDNTDSILNSSKPCTPVAEHVDNSSGEMFHDGRNRTTSPGKRKRHQVSKIRPAEPMGAEKPHHIAKTLHATREEASTRRGHPREEASIENVNVRKCHFQGCAWKTLSHGGQWQAFYNHIAHRHGDQVPDTWWIEEGRFLCKECNKHYDLGKRDTHTKSCTSRRSLPQIPQTTPPSSNIIPAANPHLNDTPQPDLRAASAPADQSTESQSAQVDLPLPSLSSVSALPINTCKDIPDRCRQEWAKTLCGCISTAICENTLQAWTLLAMLPKCVLPAPHRGGNRAKASYASHVKKCLARWRNGEFLALWNEAVSSLVRKKKSVAQAQDIDDEIKKAALRAKRLVRDSELSRAMTALTSEPLAPDDEATYAKLLSKHPPRLSTSNVDCFPARDVEPLKATEEEVAEALSTFHRGSSGGAFGLRPEHLQTAMQYHHDAYTDPLGTLTKFVNHMLAGKVPLEVKGHYAGGRLCALKKGERDVRPIAAGETLRRLTSKVTCFAAKEQARKLLKGHQYGVATPAGSERVIHLCRKTIAEHIDDDDFILCKVDLKNAFNNVSRDSFTALARRHFPKLGCYVEWCYNAGSILTFGSRTIESSEGVQQGDPLGPLLFSLVMKEVAWKIRVAAPNLDLNMWFLDDGGTSRTILRRTACSRRDCDNRPKMGITPQRSKVRAYITPRFLPPFFPFPRHSRFEQKWGR